ncbi:MAG: carboxymuconolactone decarboxylase family protein [Aquisalimonadaceae bacterium]
MKKESLHAKGLATRREVLGDAYVDKSLDNADEFAWPLQELVTEYCWDAIWNRPGLPRKTRSLVNIAMFTALNRPHELRAHLVGAIRNGCTEEEIREVLLQGAVYCGMPAGIDAFRVAKEVLADINKK